MFIRNSLFTLGLAVLSVAPACPPPIHFAMATFSPTSLTFSPQVANPGASPSATQTVTLTASGSLALSITSIDASGDFSETNNCPSSLAIKASCDIQVSFTPNSIGAIMGAVTLTSNAVGGPHVVSLMGTGMPPVGLLPASMNFGSVAVNTTSAAQVVTLTNNQNAALAINSVGVTGDYSQTNNCPSSLGAGASCQVSVKFRPTLAASIPGALNVVTDASPNAQPIALTGIGTGSGSSNVGFSSATLAFGNEEAGTSSSQKTVTVTNKGGASLTIQSVGVSAGYTSTGNCAGSMLSPGSTCTVDVKFQPQAHFAPVNYPGAVTFIDSDATSPQVVGLTGTGVAPITFSPQALDFGDVLANTTTPSQTITLTNHDAASESLTTAISGGFSLSNDACSGNNLNASATCQADLSFASHTFGSAASGPISGALTITPSSGGFLSPQVLSLQACVTQLLVSPPSFNFGAVPVGSSSPPETLTLYSPNGVNFNASAVTLTGANPGDFTISSNTCTGSASSCTMDVTYAPQAGGVRSGTVSITDDDGCSPHQSKLTGGSSAGPFTVYANVTGNNAGGEIVSSPAGIDCMVGGGTCSASFPSGTSVTLSALPDTSQPGSHISGWSGDCTGSGGCVLDMNSDKEAMATFVPDPQLTVMITGTGNGTVKSNPAVIDCEVPITSTTVCAATFPVNTSVTLTATAAAGSSFSGWSGGGCSGTGTCTFTSTTDQTVSAALASLNPPDFSLSASALSPTMISAGQSATSTLSIAAVNGFTNSVALTCSPQSAPSGTPKCAINPASVSPGGTAMLTVSTTAPSSAQNLATTRVLFALGIPTLIGTIVIGSRRKSPWNRRLFALFLGATVLSSLMLQIACGGTSNTTTGGGHGGTPKGSYTITVTGVSGSMQHSTALTLVVQ